MRLKSVESLVPGDVLGQPVYGKSGQVLLQVDVALTSSYIRRLRQYGCTYVFVRDPRTEDVELQQSISSELRQEIVRKIHRTLDRFANGIERRSLLREGELGATFRDLFNMLFQNVLKNQVVLTNLTSMYSSDTFLYSHCMNVALYAGAVAIGYGYSEAKVRDLGVGAMLHDIGKLAIDRKILDKPGALTEDEKRQVEMHCQLGYDMLTQQPNISRTSAHCALQHHEKFDGTGYPRGLVGEEIHEVGRILAVADVYDALTSNRAYRKAFLPHEAVEVLYGESNAHFDPKFVQLFVKHVNVYPPGTPVTLNQNLSGIVVDINTDQLMRPVVRILQESNRDVTPYDIDLSKHLNFVISRCDDHASVSFVG
ncbi:MAG: HD-GYP domain-containing protein [Alicyclobacillaceae bacterium]|nr:HD-GYP domain-containing protein [Alicyclobacillaceae bacterium]